MVNNFNEQSAKFNGAGNQNVNKPKVGGSSMSVKPQVTKAKSNKLPKEVLAKILAKKKIGAVAAAAEAKENSINFPMLPMMSITQSTRLDKSIFIPSNIRVIGQANKEVIVCALVQSKNTKVSPANNSNVNSRSLLLAFDQHAVHERIRLETLRKATFHELTGNLITRRVAPPVEYSISAGQWKHISSKMEIFEKIVGLKCSLKKPNAEAILKSGDKKLTLIVQQVPSCFRCYLEPELFDQFINDSVEFFSNTENLLPANGTIPRPKLAPFLLEQLKTQACRGSIRFGELLSPDACLQMLNSLARCQQPFRCAHGRVHVKPICYLPTAEEISTDSYQKSEEEDCMQNMITEFEKMFGSSLEVKTVPKYDESTKKLN